MSDTNYFSGVVKILENPIKTFSNDKISGVTFHAEISQIKKNKIITLRFWGNLGLDIKSYYHVNDYILVEGYLSIQNNKTVSSIAKSTKQLTLTALKIYPFFINSTHIISKV